MPQFVAVAIVKLLILFVTAGALCWSSEFLPGVRKQKNQSSSSLSREIDSISSTRPLARPLDRLPSQHAAPYTGPFEWDDHAASAAEILERNDLFHRIHASSLVGNQHDAEIYIPDLSEKGELQEGATNSVSYGEPTPEKCCAIIVAGLNAEHEGLN